MLGVFIAKGTRRRTMRGEHQLHLADATHAGLPTIHPSRAQAAVHSPCTAAAAALVVDGRPDTGDMASSPNAVLVRGGRNRILSSAESSIPTCSLLGPFVSQ